MRLPRLPFAGWLWILSGLPVGLLLFLSPPPVWNAFFAFAVLLEVGHALSPIVFAWTHAGYRRLIFKYPGRYIVVPGGFLLAAFAVGAATSLGWTSFVAPTQDLTGQSYAFTDWRNPFGIMVTGYFWWNVHHFGMQNFGVLSMCRTAPRVAVPRGTWRIGTWEVRQPRPAAAACLAVTALGMVLLPKIVSREYAILFYGLIFVNHWIVAIGLPTRVEAALGGEWARARAAAFAIGVVLLGAVGFVWSAPAWMFRAYGHAVPANAPDFMLIREVIPVVLGLRYGLSFVHFLYDRHIWKMGDPEVRAIIGHAFAARTVAPGPVPSLALVPRAERRRARRVA